MKLFESYDEHVLSAKIITQQIINYSKLFIPTI